MSERDDFRLDPGLEALLASPGPRAPDGFTDRVMLRVQRAEAVRGTAWRAPMPLGDAMPWWARAAREPGVVLAFAIAALLAWQAPQLIAAAFVAARTLGEGWQSLAGRGASSGTGFAIQLAIGTVLTMAAVPLYRLFERAALRTR